MFALLTLVERRAKRGVCTRPSRSQRNAERPDPVKLNRLKRKREKKARWSNFYKTVEVTNEILTPPVESDVLKGNKDSTEAKVPEPELDDDKVTLSWYDSDLNQYLILPELNSVVPLSDGAFSHAWAGARASHGVTDGRVCYEVSVGAVVTTTESSEKEPIVSGLRVGWSTDNSTLHLGEGELSWGYESNARAVNNGEFKEYGQQLQEKDVVGVYLDLESTPCKISYTVNGIEQGVAFEFPKESLQGRPMFPHVLTKNTCYRINLGHDRYNMLTKTKIVRKRLEIPIEEVIEEKRKIEAELQRQKEELERMEKEKKEKEKKEREERQRKRKEERERQDKERKEKEAQERKERGEEVEETEDKQDDNDKEKQADNTDKEDEQPKENGDKPEEESQPEPEVKPEPMETETTEDEKPTAPESAVAVGEVIEVTEEQVLKGQITLDKRVKFVTRYTVEEELEGAEACLVPGYSFIGHAPAQPGPRRPAARADCEVILMVGMPGSGKTYWARQHAAAHPDKRYNIISTGALFDRMKVDCKPFRSSYEGRWDAMVSKCAKCVLKLLEIAKGRRRNYILDQTNVYPSAQRRKLKEFDGYRRVAVVIVTDEETYKERHKRREEADGKEVPDGAIVDMKANFTLPEKSTWLDEVLYPELGEEEAKAVVEALHKEAKAAGVGKEREKRDRSGSRDGPSSKRARDDRRHRDDRRSREFQRDREDRWGIGGGSGGGSRWGPAGRGGGGAGGGGGGRWGSRERAGPAPAGGPPQRFDRWGPPNRNTDFSRDREDFRGGRGAPGGRGGPGGRGPGGPPGGPRDRGMGPQGMDGRFRGPDRNNRGPPPDKRQAPPGAQSGSWQRGGAQPQNRSQPRPNAPPGPRHPNQKEGQMQSSQSPQQGWNQWAGGWGGWGNWNQNQAGWGNWGNWGNWNPNASGQGGQSAGKGQAQAQVQGQQQTQTQTQTQGQWPANYTAQQWYQWQQWQQQQQQQGWPGYQQGAQQSSAGAGGNAAEQAWAQYYQNYGAGNAANAALGAAPAADNK